MFRGWRCILIAFALLMIGVGAASALTTVTVNRCGYAAKGFYGKDAIYPWHMSCAQARRILAGAVNPHAKHINLTADGAATGDAAPVLIDGRWWVCGGRMGFYFCGYPYRSAYVSGTGGANHLEGSLHKGVRLPLVLGSGAPAVSETLSICRTEGHCAGDRSPNTGQSTNHRGKSRGWATPGSSRAGETGPERRHACYGLKPNVPRQLETDIASSAALVRSVVRTLLQHGLGMSSLRAASAGAGGTYDMALIASTSSPSYPNGC